MYNLANRYSEAGRLTEALQLAEEMVKLRKSKSRLAPSALMSYPCTLWYRTAGAREADFKAMTWNGGLILVGLLSRSAYPRFN